MRMRTRKLLRGRYGKKRPTNKEIKEILKIDREKKFGVSQPPEKDGGNT